MTWYQIGSTWPLWPELHRRNIPLTRADSLGNECARGDLNPHVLADTGT
jgi:hypothetical protein